MILFLRRIPILSEEPYINKFREHSFVEKIGIDKIKYIKTYSANSISELSNNQIQTIIDHFAKKPNVEFAEDPEGQNRDKFVSDSEEATPDELPEVTDQNSECIGGASKSLGFS